VVGTGRVNTVLVGDDFPELGTDLVTALACLDMNNFSHLLEEEEKREGKEWEVRKLLIFFCL